MLDSSWDICRRCAKEGHPEIREGEVYLGNTRRGRGCSTNLTRKIPQTRRYGDKAYDMSGQPMGRDYQPIFAQRWEAEKVGILEPSLVVREERRMYNHEPEGYICPLCQIVRGEPTAKGPSEEAVITRTQHLTVFIAGKWWRSNPGHVIIVPNEHIENIYDLPYEIIHTVGYMTRSVAIALKQAYSCDGVSTLQHNEPAGNQEVWHYHFHVVPRTNGDNFYQNFEDTYWPTMDEKSPLAKKLRAVLLV